MSETTKELISREEVPEEQTWKLEDIFETDELWEKKYEQLQKDIPQIGKFRGKIAESSGNLYELLHLQDKISERLGKLFVYARMRYDQDTTNSFYRSEERRVGNECRL